MRQERHDIHGMLQHVKPFKKKSDVLWFLSTDVGMCFIMSECGFDHLDPCYVSVYGNIEGSRLDKHDSTVKTKHTLT